MSEMEVTPEMLEEIAAKARSATPGPWKLWTGCSWRRFGSEATGQAIIEPTNHPMDGHPDLLFRNRADPEYIIAAQPAVVLALVKRIRGLEDDLRICREVAGELGGERR